MTKVLYIAGYGRSGSTVLAGVLGCDVRTTSVGEVSFLFEDGSSEDRICSCGSSYSTCERWAAWTRNLADSPQVPGVVRSIEGVRGFHRLWRGTVPPHEARLYARAQADLFDHVASVTGSDVVVDGSKTAWLTLGRPVALAELADIDIRVLHLVRDGRRVLASTSKLSNWELEGRRRPRRPSVVRSTFGWMLANLTAEKLRSRLGDERYMRMRWEDFLTDPADAVRAIGAFVGVDYSELASQMDRETEFDVGHVVGGNRVRFSGSFRLEPPTSNCGAHTLAPWQVAIFALLGRRLNKRYGYDSNDASWPMACLR